MKQRNNLVTLHQLATTYHLRPSAFLNIEDDWAAYQLDQVTLMVGRQAEEVVQNKGSLELFLKQGAVQQFRKPPPKQHLRKVAMSPKGVW